MVLYIYIYIYIYTDRYTYSHRHQNNWRFTMTWEAGWRNGIISTVPYEQQKINRHRQIILFQRIYYLSISLTGLPCHREPSIVSDIVKKILTTNRVMHYSFDISTCRFNVNPIYLINNYLPVKNPSCSLFLLIIWRWWYWDYCVAGLRIHSTSKYQVPMFFISKNLMILCAQSHNTIMTIIMLL